MLPTKNARAAAAKAPAQSSFKHNAIALCVLGCLSAMPVEAASYTEQGRLHNAASWRSEEFKSNWGLGAVGADYAYARGLSGAGVQMGIYDSGTDLRHGEFAGKPVVGVLMADPGCMSGSVLENGCFYTEGDRAAVTVIDSLPPEALAGLEESIADGTLTREQLDEYLGFVGTTYDAHGTHVAGTALANRDGSGVHGVAYAANLSAVRKFGNTYLGGPIAITSALRLPLPTVAAVDAVYAQLHKQNVRVVNNSWGSAFSPANAAELDIALSDTQTPVYAELRAIADNAIKYGILQVWSAGNVTTANESPQKAPNSGLHPNLPRAIAELEPYWLTVVNLTKELTLSDYSRRCGFSKDWCLAAPGTDINSSWVSGSIQTENHYGPDGDVIGFTVTGDKPDSGYALSSGTSMAAPTSPAAWHC